MRHFPIFLNVQGRRIIVAGAGETAVAKLRLLLKTEAHINVFGEHPHADIMAWANDGLITLHKRPLITGDALCAALVYCANDHQAEDARVANLGREAGALVNIVDNAQDSAFITPAIVDRDPVVVAIGTEGSAPVLARKIKAEVETLLPVSLGLLARVGESFRQKVKAISQGPARRKFWSRFYFEKGPRAFASGGQQAVEEALERLLTSSTSALHNDRGHVALIGAGPGDPGLLTLKAHKFLHEADVVIHDRLVSNEILELARREAIIIETGKTGFGPSWDQADINALMIHHARRGARVARLKSGDPSVFGRMDEELDALAHERVSSEVIPGITTASAAAANIGASLTRRNRNSAFQIVTGQDLKGYAEQDWRDLAKPGSVAAIYMGVKSARFICGRLLMHGAARTTPVTVIEHVSRSCQKTVSGTLADLPDLIIENGINGPALVMLGLQPRKQVSKKSVQPGSADFLADEIFQKHANHRSTQMTGA